MEKGVRHFLEGAEGRQAVGFPLGPQEASRPADFFFFLILTRGYFFRCIFVIERKEGRETSMLERRVDWLPSVCAQTEDHKGLVWESYTPGPGPNPQPRCVP